MEDNGILVNLVAQKCQSLTFTTESGISNANLAKLALDKNSRMPISYFYLYEKENKKHLIRIRFLPHGITVSTVISVIYRVLGKDEPIPFMVQGNRSSKALDYYAKLCELDLSLLFRCETVFINKRDEGTFIPFPMKVPPQSPTSSFDEIRGMRIAKVKDNKILMENYMDLVDDNTLSQTIKFAYEAKFTLDLPLTIVQESKKLI